MTAFNIATGAMAVAAIIGAILVADVLITTIKNRREK